MEHLTVGGCSFCLDCRLLPPPDLPEGRGNKPHKTHKTHKTYKAYKAYKPYSTNGAGCNQASCAILTNRYPANR